MPDNYDGDDTAGTRRSVPDNGRRPRNLILLPQSGESLSHHQIHTKMDRMPIPSPPSSQRLRVKKMGFTAAAFRGLGCSTSSSSQVYTPAVATASAAAAAVRSSADWQGKRSRSRKKESKVKKNERERKNQAAAVTAADMCCAPGMGFSSAADASVDCVAPSFQQSRGRGLITETDRIRAKDVVTGRAGGGANPEQLSSLLDSPQSPFDVPMFGSELIPPRHLHRARRIHRSPVGLDEIMMFQARLMLGDMNMNDRYRDWRLDVDNMTYEELLELGDRIGHVNTGLREEEIFRCLRKMKHTVLNGSAWQFSTELERKCSICQEDYEANDEVGKLDCGHGYHMYCIKEWLLRKNACPVCKATVSKS